MGHHFDSPTSVEDPRIDPTDFFVFPGAGNTTVFVLNVNPDAGCNAPAQFRDETLYEIRIDVTGDLTEDVALQATFSAAARGSDEQVMTVTLARGDAAGRTEPGEQVGQGAVGTEVALSGGGRAWAGKAADPFTANFSGHAAFIGALMGDGALRPEVFSDGSLHEGHPANSFSQRDVMSLVFEVPNSVLGDAGTIGAWAVSRTARRST